MINMIFALMGSLVVFASPPVDSGEVVRKMEQAIETGNRFTFGYYLDLLEREDTPFKLNEGDYLRLMRKASAASTAPCFMNILMANMEESHPRLQMGRYFFDHGGLKDKGLKMILDANASIYEGKSRAAIAGSADELKKEIAQALKSDLSNGIFYHEGENAHWSLIYFNKDLKKGRQCAVQILDAAGHPQVYDISSILKKSIPEGCEVQVEKHRRQNDSSNCSVFAITDFLELSKQGALTQSFYNDLTEGNCKGSKVSSAGFSLSPDLMSLTQSYRVINSYIEENKFKNEDSRISELLNRIKQVTAVIPRYTEQKRLEQLKELAEIDPSDSTLRSQLLLNKLVKSDMDPSVLFGEFCEEDEQLYYGSNKERKINVGAKISHDKYAIYIIEKLAHQNPARPSSEGVY